jgi:CIC family chloride channel protein
MQPFRIPAPARQAQIRLREETHVLRKWVGIGALVGVACGAAAIMFLWLIGQVTHLLLQDIAGYQSPESGGFTLSRPWLLPLVPALGGLLGGLLVWRLAPTASGIGTDAAIRAFHEQHPISMKTTAIKLVASALTIGSGGTSGREGPIAQVGAGTGSTIARWLNFSPRDHGIAMAAGLGAGIAAMFKAPLAGTIIAAEVFYREDFEVEALIPTLVAAVIGYSFVGFTFGWQPVFQTHLDPFQFGNPVSLLLYAVLGAACGLLARLGIAVFYPVQSSFRLTVTTLGIAPTLGTGAAWLQQSLDHARLGSAALPLAGVFLLACLAELAGITLTLGSGGSGGIFGPSLVVGGFLGAAFGTMATSLFPGIAPDIAPYVVVGMIAYFAGAAKAPIGTIVLVVEMTGGYALLGPAMVATMFSFLLSGHGSMFASQVKNRLASPAHASEFEATVLHRHQVSDVANPNPTTVEPDTPVIDALAYLQKTEAWTLPVMQAGRLVGMCTLRDLQRVPEADRPNRRVADVAARLVTVTPSQDLFHVLATLLENDCNALPVVSERDSGHLVGLVTRRDIGAVVKASRTRKPSPTAAGLTKGLLS